MKHLALLLLGAVWILLPAHAQGLAIAPILVEAPAGGGPASLTVSSALDHDVTIQVRVYDWHQEAGEDVLEPASKLRFAPEIFTLQSGASQVVRMAVPDTGGTGAWRIIIDELPSPAARHQADAAQLSIRLRYVLAMFAGAPAGPDQLQARLEAGAVELSNPGPGWLRLHNLSLETPTGETLPAGPGIVYLLPGSALSLPPPAAPQVHQLNYSVGGVPFEAPLRSAR